MSTPAPAQSQALTSLPTLEDLPRTSGGGYEPDGVEAPASTEAPDESE